MFENGFWQAKRKAPERVDISNCRACGAPIIFLQLETTGKAHPVEPEPTTDGKIYMVSSGEVRIIRGEELRKFLVRHNVPLFHSHFDKCPKAARFRKNKNIGR